MAHDVFISYSKSDKATADALCNAMESLGIRCWIAPRDVLPGADWTGSIIRAIGLSRLMVLVFSSHANASPHVKREVHRAFEKGLTVIPLRVEEVAPTASLQYFIGPVHWLDALTPPLELHLRRLAKRVRALLDGPTRPVAGPAGPRAPGPVRSRTGTAPPPQAKPSPVPGPVVMEAAAPGRPTSGIFGRLAAVGLVAFGMIGVTDLIVSSMAEEGANRPKAPPPRPVADTVETGVVSPQPDEARKPIAPASVADRAPSSVARTKPASPSPAFKPKALPPAPASERSAVSDGTKARLVAPSPVAVTSGTRPDSTARPSKSAGTSLATGSKAAGTSAPSASKDGSTTIRPRSKAGMTPAPSIPPVAGNSETSGNSRGASPSRSDASGTGTAKSKAKSKG